MILIFLAFVPKDNEPLEKLVNAIQQWADSLPQEKVYLHMDKPYYALGDTIWFKAYVTTGSRHQLSAISGALYVDLIDERDSIISVLKLPLTAGMSMGNFTLRDELKEGNYTIRAYTQWMRNAGVEYFFDHTFTVVNPLQNGVLAKAEYSYPDAEGKRLLNAVLNYTDETGAPLIKKKISYEVVDGNETILNKTAETDSNGNIFIPISVNKEKDWSKGIIRTTITLPNRPKFEKQFPIKANFLESDIQFFPESGNLVYGVTSKLAYKAVGTDGNGLSVKGEVFDEEQHHIADFISGYAGMGSFLIKPEPGKIYNAKITFPDGSQKSIALPKPVINGFVLSIFQPNADSILVRIRVPEQMVTREPGFVVNCIIHSSGEIIAATPVKINKTTSSLLAGKKGFSFRYCSVCTILS